jgi:hypothetical protein
MSSYQKMTPLRALSSTNKAPCFHNDVETQLTSQKTASISGNDPTQPSAAATPQNTTPVVTGAQLDKFPPPENKNTQIWLIKPTLARPPPKPPLYSQGRPKLDSGLPDTTRIDANAISPNDITQGRIGDCYLLSAIKGIAGTNPQGIAKLITENKNDTYSVKLFNAKSGAWESFSVDLPEVRLGNLSKGGDNGEVWVRVLECAYAKLLDKQKHPDGRGLNPNGDLVDLGNGGWPNDAMTALTGSPATHETMSASSTTVSKISTALANGQAVNISTNVNLPSPNENNLVGLHAYNVTAITLVGGRHVLTLSNPWNKKGAGGEPQSPGLAPNQVYLDSIVLSGTANQMYIAQTPPTKPLGPEVVTDRKNQIIALREALVKSQTMA